ncbi:MULTISPECIES: helix-turn-helix domain-containing protein [Flavobacteriaceae]|nr:MULTISPECIES: AraC family transcriptional regulator [Flavobacteriaceae]MEC7783093.1 AraC family transcriptional regulator [Bacteroidota bacterium]UBZ10895.1 AraC family transcriptional regulator [Leeuwenhoekiella palythoae]HBO29465.1 AraC family transcriptional regulator [Leeuwenhoekiella sp.]HBT09076.1 AraC family transcriptional regulator [Leeuwenhoekiella sp.]HCQ78318.1 AraC family transcriptional regulator [Leeuwenhoekiella sp.]|tara:strand:+ start:3028 stop:3942 length:915 start_codon:yes stop_codon:yes gene_type:complete
MNKKSFKHVSSVTEVHRMLNIKSPKHPLISVINLDELNEVNEAVPGSFINDFYSVFIKKDFDGKMKYGQQWYDFDEGVMIFCGPGQLIAVETPGKNKPQGWWLLFHPDFLQTYPLANRINEFGFFKYEMNEALHLSDEEEANIGGIMEHIHKEYQTSIDHFSQDVIISHLEVLLNYSNRYYNRQFITRKPANTSLLSKLEQTLNDYFEKGLPLHNGLPTVGFLSNALHVSPNYLSDMLRATTGQTTQHYIHQKVIEKSKVMLSTSDLTASEVAYQMGFDYPQSFSKLFKAKTKMSPIQFRKSLN